MKLISVRVQNFRSIEDSGEFSIDDTTCLVGKNEAGKTAILQALGPVNAWDKNQQVYDKLLDYPRRYLNEYEQRHPKGEATVATTKWLLNDDDVNALKEEFGPNCFSDMNNNEITVTKSYEQEGITLDIPFNGEKAIEYLISETDFNEGEKAELDKCKTFEELIKNLEALETPTETQKALLDKIRRYQEKGIKQQAIDILSNRMPKFLYFSHYDRMNGKISIKKLEEDKKQGKLSEGDKLFLDFLKFAGTDLEELKSIKQSENLKAKVEAASIRITDRIFEYWSQNQSLSIEFEPYEGKPGDDPPFNAGTVMEARVDNSIHRMSVPFSERSAGFIWFFSFLVRFSQVIKEHSNVIILLDEPGLSLHAKAQSDLLRFIKEKLEPNHQVIYTAHSPFMVPADNLMSVRTVEDVVVQKAPMRFDSKGTEVGDKVLSTDRDTLFPLQGALGYEITQTLFVGKNTLLVEGPSDILYLQAASTALKGKRRMGLDPRWTICPTGGIDKISPFVSLFCGNSLNVAVLTDYAKGQKGKVERLRQSQLLKEGRVYTYADFCGKEEADVEDMLSPGLFVTIINKAYKLSYKHQLTVDKLEAADAGTERQVLKAEAYFRSLPNDIPVFDHFIPANWLIQNLKVLTSGGKEIEGTLNRFEEVFKALNKLLD
ncbi:MAG: AAA family ATPase [Candidatus Brocadiales bacterium]